MDLNKSEVLDSPIIIVGPLRSGTSMLRLLLGRNSLVNAFGEFEFSVSSAVGDHWADIEEYKKFLSTDRQALSYKLSVRENVDYEGVVHSFLDQLYDRSPNKFLCTSVHSRVDLLPKLWPQAKFIHLLRDPRDVARSCIAMGWVGNTYYGADYWIDVENHWNKAVKKYPSISALEVRYEQLVSNPEEELKRICDFVGLEYDSSMLALEESSTYSKPSSKYANQWKRKLSAKEIKWVEAKARTLMLEKGYEESSDKGSKIGFIEKAILFINNRSYRILFNIRRWGGWNWLLYVLSKKVGPVAFASRMQLKINEINSTYLK